MTKSASQNVEMGMAKGATQSLTCPFYMLAKNYDFVAVIQLSVCMYCVDHIPTPFTGNNFTFIVSFSEISRFLKHFTLAMRVMKKTTEFLQKSVILNTVLHP